MKRILSCLVLLAMLLSVLTFTVPNQALAAGNQSAVYSDISNSGTRDVVCTTLSGTGAADYYTGGYTYASLSAQSGDALLQSLRKLMTDTHKKQSSYKDCRDMAVNTDCQNENGKVMLIYTSFEATRSQYINDTSGGWNREHIWPKSLGGFDDDEPGAGTDLHHIRPSDQQVNSKRASQKYGNASSGSAVRGTAVTGNALGGYSGAYFEPLDNVKGDVARICLYVYVRYGGEIPKSSKITNVFESVDVLLEWMALDPVDTWEMGRNEVVEAYQGNRNVFIDYPELAWLLFGKEVPATLTSPSGSQSGTTPPATEVTEPTAAPTEPTAASTEPTAAPTEPTAAPTEPTAVPSEPTAAPTEPATTPTESTITTVPATGPVPTDSPTQPPAANPDLPEPGDFTWVIILAVAVAGIAAVIVVIVQKRKKD